LRAAEQGGRRENSPYRISRLNATVFYALFMTGMAEGGVEYSRRSPAIAKHIAGSNAITVHVVLALAAAAAVVAIQARRAQRPAQAGRSPWAAPFSANALKPLSRTIRLAAGPSLPNLARAIATTALVLALAFEPFRMGSQVTGGLDPNATVNAWGGPTYVGALLAHWLDCLVGFYTIAFLLSRLALPTAVCSRYL